MVVTFESADERLKYGKEVIFFDYVVPLLILASQNTETYTPGGTVFIRRKISESFLYPHSVPLQNLRK